MRMVFVPTASTDAIIGLFWDTIIKYHMLPRCAAERMTHVYTRQCYPAIRSYPAITCAHAVHTI
jgi:hypothetical protein